MSNLENDLNAALRRVEPPENFTERVLARLNDPVREPSWWEPLLALLQPPRIQWVALSLLASILIPVGAVQYHREMRQRAEGEMAKKQLVLAVRVAGNKLHRVQQKVLEIGRMDTRL